MYTVYISYIYIYVYIHIKVHILYSIYIYIYVYACINMHIHIYIYVFSEPARVQGLLADHGYEFQGCYARMCWQLAATSKHSVCELIDGCVDA